MGRGGVVPQAMNSIKPQTRLSITSSAGTAPGGSPAGAGTM